MNEKLRALALILATVILIIYIIIDKKRESNCFVDNIPIAKRLQANSSKSSDNFYNFWSFWGYGPQQSGILLVYYEFSRKKATALTLILLMLFLNYFLNVLKISYADPRPYMINDEVKAIRCSKGFGNPSGHAMGCIVLFFILANNLRILLFDTKERIIDVEENNNTINLKQPSRENDSVDQASKVSDQANETNSNGALNNQRQTPYGAQPSKSAFHPKKLSCWDKWKGFLRKYRLLNLLLQALLMCLAFLFIAIIGISRIYLGSHTLCQVILGWFYGGFLIILYYTVLKKWIPHRIKAFCQKNRESKQKVNYAAIFLWVLLYAATILLIWFLYYFKGRVDEDIHEWIENIIKKCGEDVEDEIKLNDKTFYDSGVIGIDFGIMLGIIVTKGEYKEKLFRTEYLKLGVRRIIFRILVFAAVLGPIYLIFNYIPWGENIYVQFFVKAHLQYFLIGFLLVLVPPKIYQALKISVDGDFLKVGSRAYQMVDNKNL